MKNSTYLLPATGKLEVRIKEDNKTKSKQNKSNLCSLMGPEKMEQSRIHTSNYFLSADFFEDQEPNRAFEYIFKFHIYTLCSINAHKRTYSSGFPFAGGRNFRLFSSKTFETPCIYLDGSCFCKICGMRRFSFLFRRQKR